MKVSAIGNSLGFACTSVLKEIGAERGDIVEVRIRLVKDGAGREEERLSVFRPDFRLTVSS